ncbi:MAG: hypothetical protein J6Y24_10725 [Bacteroidales bacterium]|nr:hypothetical protein [Bacteroidales bacterium]
MIAQASLDAQIFRYMAKIADNTDLKTQLVKFLKQLTAKKPDPTEMTKEEFFEKLERSRQQIKRGEGIVINNEQELEQFFNTL